MLALLLTLLVQAADEERFTLPNGLDVVIKEAGKHDAVAVALAVRAGTITDPDGKVGLSHAVEHLVCFGATKSFKEREAFDQLTQAGVFKQPFMDANAETMPDLTYYYALVRADRLELAVQAQAERLRSCVFTKELLDQERPRLAQETRSVATSPFARIYGRATALAYGKHRYACAKAGVEKDLATVTVEDATKYYDTWYRPGNALLVIYGKVAGAKALVEKHFGPIPAADVPRVEREAPADPAGARETLEVDRGAMPPQLMVAWLAPPGGTKEHAALIVAVQCLLQGLKIDGLAQPAMLDVDPYAPGRGLVLLNAVPKDPARLAAVETAVWSAVESLDAEKGFELARTGLTNQLIANDTFQLGFVRDRDQSIRALAQLAINRLRREIVRDRTAALQKELGSLTPADVAAAAKKFLRRDRAAVILVREKP